MTAWPSAIPGGRRRKTLVAQAPRHPI